MIVIHLWLGKKPSSAKYWQESGGIMDQDNK